MNRNGADILHHDGAQSEDSDVNTNDERGEGLVLLIEDNRAEKLPRMNDYGDNVDDGISVILLSNEDEVGESAIDVIDSVARQEPEVITID